MVKCEIYEVTSQMKAVQVTSRVNIDSCRTYILDIIRCYGLVATINGPFSYNNNVQPFLICSVLEGHEETITT